MSALQLPKKRVEALDPADLERHLRAHGWEQRREIVGGRVGLFRHPSYPDEVFLPRDKRFVDFALRVGEVLAATAAVEKRTAWEVLEELSAGRPESSANGPPPSGRSRESPTRRPPS